MMGVYRKEEKLSWWVRSRPYTLLLIRTEAPLMLAMLGTVSVTGIPRPVAAVVRMVAEVWVRDTLRSAAFEGLFNVAGVDKTA